MATLYPISLNNFKFYVNPTKISVSKRSSISEVRTMTGTIFQLWPDLPNEISFSGIAYGNIAIAELRALASALEQNPDAKQVPLVYKFKTYQGYVRDLEVSASADVPYIFDYSFKFVTLTPFSVDTMPIGQTPSIVVDFDFFTAELSTATFQILSVPANIVNSVSNIYTQMFGKSGANNKGLGLFIGRPQSSSVLSNLTGGKLGSSTGRIG